MLRTIFRVLFGSYKRLTGKGFLAASPGCVYAGGKQEGVTRVNVQQLIVTIIIGGIAGWIAGLIVRGGGFGILGNILVGIVGGVVGSFVLSAIGRTLGAGIAGSLVSAVIGAVLLMFVVGLIKRS